MQITRIPAQRENRKTRVAVYCRVSTEKDDQEDSLEEQQKAYMELISLRSDWELVGVYSDVLSGLSAEKRPQFMEMINSALAGNIDRILCKSVSRFSRNVAECKKYTDMLRLKNVIVEFEKEHISTADTTSSFIFSLMSAIAENESRSISENMKWGQRERVKRGEYNLGNNRILGYDCVDGKLVPNDDADAIRLIYALFLEGKTIEEIRRQLADIGVQTRKGTRLSRNNILYILKNETYRGDKLLQKTHPKDLITKRPDPNVPFESKYLIGDHEALIAPAVWDAVQQKLKRNNELTEVVGHRGGQPHFLYGKVFCGECGAPMTRRTVNGPGGMKIKTWICREKRNGSGCKGRNVKEEELLAVSETATEIVVKEDGIAAE
ncbi:MAG: recombinase family protein [Syntrophales bacterium]|jgi:site-specific DNA recombinase|nr:recombinase family protein [Syntrophales bacterium]